jgi:hypothetical protein
MRRTRHHKPPRVRKAPTALVRRSSRPRFTTLPSRRKTPIRRRRIHPLRTPLRTNIHTTPPTQTLRALPLRLPRPFRARPRRALITGHRRTVTDRPRGSTRPTPTTVHPSPVHTVGMTAAHRMGLSRQVLPGHRRTRFPHPHCSRVGRPMMRARAYLAGPAVRDTNSRSTRLMFRRGQGRRTEVGRVRLLLRRRRHPGRRDFIVPRRIDLTCRGRLGSVW